MGLLTYDCIERADCHLPYRGSSSRDSLLIAMSRVHEHPYFNEISDMSNIVLEAESSMFHVFPSESLIQRILGCHSLHYRTTSSAQWGRSRATYQYILHHHPLISNQNLRMFHRFRQHQPASALCITNNPTILSSRRTNDPVQRL